MIDREKAILRDHYRELRRGLSQKEKSASDAALAAQFIQSEYYRQCRRLFLYISLPAEVDTAPILQTAWRDGKEVAAPVCLPETHRMVFYRIGGEDDLVCGHYGIREPDSRRCAPLVPDKDSLCLVPGFAFDVNGCRLGYGGGYYDRFLVDFPGKTVGLCREKWLAEHLPADCYDLPVQAVVMENSILVPGGTPFERRI